MTRNIFLVLQQTNNNLIHEAYCNKLPDTITKQKTILISSQNTANTDQKKITANKIANKIGSKRNPPKKRKINIKKN